MLFDLQRSRPSPHGPRDLHRPGAADRRRPRRLRHRRRLRRRRDLQRRRQQRRRQRRELRQPGQEVPQAHRAAAHQHRRLGRAHARPCSRNRATSPSNGVTPKGKELFREASEAWQQLHGAEPAQAEHAELAQQMLRVYSEEGLNEPAKAVAGAADRRRRAAHERGSVRAARRVRLQSPQHAHRRPRGGEGGQPRSRRPTARAHEERARRSARPTRAAKRPTRRPRTAKPTPSRKPPTAASRAPKSKPRPPRPARHDEHRAPRPRNSSAAVRASGAAAPASPSAPAETGDLRRPAAALTGR